jgi:hypothetical protein
MEKPARKQAGSASATLRWQGVGRQPARLGFTNSTTRVKPAYYLVIFQTAWNGDTPHYL